MMTPGHSQANTDSLVAELAKCSAETRLFVSFAPYQYVQGQFVGVMRDSLVLELGIEPGQLYVLPLDAINSLKIWRSNAGRGGRQGATVGAVILGGFGVLVGLAAAAYQSDGGAGPVFLATSMGLIVGGSVGGILGVGIGALSHSWVEVWPNQAVPKIPDQPVHSTNTRLNLFAGAGRTYQNDDPNTKFSGRVAVLKKIGSVVRTGPEFSHTAFGETISTTGQNGQYTTVYRKPLSRVALVVDTSQSKTGLIPFLSLGAGWSIGEDIFSSGHVGGGLRRRNLQSFEFDLDLRYHFNFSNVGSKEVGKFWTLGLAIGFSL